MKFQCHLMCIDENNIYENGKYCRPQYDNAALQKWYFKKNWPVIHTKCTAMNVIKI